MSPKWLFLEQFSFSFSFFLVSREVLCRTLTMMSSFILYLSVFPDALYILTFHLVPNTSWTRCNPRRSPGHQIRCHGFSGRIKSPLCLESNRKSTDPHPTPRVATTPLAVIDSLEWREVEIQCQLQRGSFGQLGGDGFQRGLACMRLTGETDRHCERTRHFQRRSGSGSQGERQGVNVGVIYNLWNTEGTVRAPDTYKQRHPDQAFT